MLTMQRHALVIAGLTLLIGVILLELYVRSFEAKATGGAKVPVLVVTGDSAAGDTLTRDKLGVRELPEAYLESRHVRATDIDRVLGAKLSVPEKAGEALLWTDISGMDERRVALSGLVSNGRRAFTVHAERASFSGLLEPGDRVDVLLAASATTLIENVMVLAVGARTDTRAAEGGSTEARADVCSSEVTLSVSVEQGRLLGAAERGNDVRLLLRNPDDVLTSASALPDVNTLERKTRE
jgi:Flp pilus assembly protein CpaB